MKHSITALAAVALAGCASTGGDTAPEAAAPPPGQMVCNADPAQYHVGHDATQAMGGATLKDSGSRTLRWGPPGGTWTMDYREDRVNVRYDGNMKITEVTCG